MAETTDPTTAPGLSPEMEECIQACQDAHRACLDALRVHLDRGESVATDLTRALLDCAQITQVSADFLLRGSSLHPRTCGVCAEACQVVAELCERSPEDQALAACAEACRRCADACAEMARMLTA